MSRYQHHANGFKNLEDAANFNAGLIGGTAYLQQGVTHRLFRAAAKGLEEGLPAQDALRGSAQKYPGVGGSSSISTPAIPPPPFPSLSSCTDDIEPGTRRDRTQCKLGMRVEVRWQDSGGHAAWFAGLVVEGKGAGTLKGEYRAQWGVLYECDGRVIGLPPECEWRVCRAPALGRTRSAQV